MAEINLTLAGLETKGGVLNIGRSRMRAIYRRPDGSLTTPLPADPYSQTYYFRKGFRAPTSKVPTEVETVPPSNGKIACPLCSFKAESAFGLASHLRKHDRPRKVNLTGGN